MFEYNCVSKSITKYSLDTQIVKPNVNTKTLEYFKM